ncbi:endonuclease/exonuclease/phosphatase family protein [Gillisia sp. CAL575]|uniref:endonuclease/exonuclease/phosphatase family protein n=1 Tax=Gillisia sp. CAL575 TaxID=985255 RepID=UPI0003A96878|nr:endonuclease/exonuclease/phosphatase family protein [Gillisia sp. CAL575]
MKTKFVRNLLFFLSFCISIFTILPTLFPNIWWIDLMSHFRVQYLVVLIFVLILFILIGFRRVVVPVIILIFLFIWNAVYILPLYISPENVSENSEYELKILSINLLSSNTDTTKVLALIKEKDPDVLVLMELTPHWERKLNGVFQSYPFYKAEPRSDNFGIALFSKIEMSSSIVYFENSPKPSIKADLILGDRPLSILATHPVPPIGSEMFNSRNKQLQDIAKKRADFSGNFILIGDLNTSSFSSHFKDLLANANLVDSRNGFGIATTWPADFYPLRTTLDHCLIGGELYVLERETGKNIGSDHLPIYIEIGI